MTFLLPVVGLVMGILIGERFNSLLLSLLSIGVALAFYLYLLGKSANPLEAIKINPLHKIWILVLFLGIGWFDMWVHTPSNETHDIINSDLLATGVVEECKTNVEGERFILKIYSLTDSTGKTLTHENFKIRLITDGYYAAIGDVLTTRLHLTEIEDSKNYRSSGYSHRMNQIGIRYSSIADSDSVLKVGHELNIFTFAASLRNDLLIKLDKSKLNRDCKYFLAALLFGDRDTLGENEREKFSNAGLAHILALSGTHIALLMGVLMFIFYPLKWFGLHKTRSWLSIIIIWCYTILSGFSPSTVRASIMISITILAFTMQRRKSSYNSLLIAIFMILLFDPLSLFDLGLQLSILSVSAIIIFVNEFDLKESFRHPISRYIISTLMISIVATMATWVIVSNYFGIVPLLFLPANFILLPLLPIFMSISLIFFCSLLIGYEPDWLSRTVEALHKSFDYVVTLISSIDGCVIDFKASDLLVWLWIAGLFAFTFFIFRKVRSIYYYILTVYFTLLVAGSRWISPQPSDSIIFQNYHHQISIMVYSELNENSVVFPFRRISETTFGGNDILVVDSIFDTTQIESIAIANRQKYRGTYLIIGKNCKIDSFPQLPTPDYFTKILLHPSLKKSTEQKILCNKPEEFKDKVYSLREEGPLEVKL